MPDTLSELLGTERPCECGRTHRVATREVALQAGALDALPDVLSRHAAARCGALIADEHTWEVAGREVLALLPGWAVAPVIVRATEPDRPVAADEETLATLDASLPDGVDFVLCVGSGTLNDLSKLTATSRGVPSFCVATAPSMNGYPSAIAAISRRGIKRTDPCEPPVAIIADTDILANAPAAMIQAGLGDLLSKSVSSADWLMAHLITGEYFCRRPVEVVREAEAVCIENAGGIGRREPAAIELLMRALILSGVSMAMAGSSSPASGGEHLISHYWDMTAHARGRKPDLHGRQVAVATLVCATLYELLKERTAGGIDLDAALARRPSSAELEAQSLAHFGPLVGREVAEEIAGLVVSKHRPAERVREALAPISARPDSFWSALGELMRPRSEIAKAHEAAGVPTRPEQVGISRDEMRQSFLYARHIRDRYTVLDLAADLGLLE